MKVTFPDNSCLRTFNPMKDVVIDGGPNPSNATTYKIWYATEEEEIWATNTLPSETFDIMWTIEPPNTEDFRVPGCTVRAKSRSQKLGSDKGENYCNMWNILNTVGGTASDKDAFKNHLNVTDCKTIPTDTSACKSSGYYYI